VDCNERRDTILLYAAGALDAGECGGLRDHLAGGCPQCAGYLAEAEAALALLGQSLPQQTPPPLLKQAILNRAKQEAHKPQSAPMRIGGWDRVILPAAIAAVLAVAVTLFVVRQLMPVNPHNPEDTAKITNLENLLVASQSQVNDLRQSLRGMQFAELKGEPQPNAVGRVFIDADMKKWYFFTCGMRPAANGKTYELWLISNDQKIPAGTFDVNDHGVAQLLGSVPQLPQGSNVTLAVTDEPMNSRHDAPTGSIQMAGQVQ
jgi:anti-sigma-K factor RskA